MDLLYRIKGILFAPEAEWRLIAGERRDMGALAIYVAVLAAIPAVARFLGDFLVGVSAPNGAVLRVSLDRGLVGAAVDYVLGVLAVALVALVANLLSRRFGAKPSYADALEVVVYSFTPYWLLGVCLLFPGLRFLCVLGVYGLALARIGLIRIMGSPRERALGYAAAVTASAIVITVAAIGLAGLLPPAPRWG